MVPEISRRCLSCGAAVRAGARFCPQCGKEMGAGVAERPEAAEQPVEAERPSPTPPPLPPPPAATPPKPALTTPKPAPTTRETEAAFDAPPTREFEAFSAGAGLAAARKDARPEPGAGEEGGAPVAEQGGRSESAAADGAGRVERVRENTRARVGRMREEALVVLEEVPDDSGMRFVVLAVLAFLLFVVVLFVSTTVLR